MAATSELEQLLQKVLDKLTDHQSYFEAIATKIGNIEVREPDGRGAANDAMRAAHKYAIGESSNMPYQACKFVCDMIMIGDRPTYWQAFLNTSIRRCEFELYKFFQAFCMNNMQAFVDTQQSIGEPVTMLPSTRVKLLQCAQNIESMLPKLHEDLVKLYQLAMPMDRCFKPTTVAELKDNQILPDDCMYTALDEEEAKLVFENLRQKYPKLEQVESIPLPPIENDKYENRHTKFLRQIRAYNVHSEKVVQAKTTIQEDQTDTKEALKAKIPKTETFDVHTVNVEELWCKNDKQGDLNIRLADEIHKRWDRESEINASTKKARTVH
jgi:hypothetical protein